MERPVAPFSRRDLLKLTLGGAAGLALDGFLDVSAMRAATQDLKLSNINEFTTSCNFCSCGCGMVAAVRDGKLITLEGDYDHIVNRGSLCVKGISMFATHASPKRQHDAPLPGAGQRPLGGHHAGRTRSSGSREKIKKVARRDLDRDREARRQGGPGQPHRRDRLHGRRAEHERGVLPVPEGGPPARHAVRRAPGPTLTQPHGPRSGGHVRAGGDDEPLGRHAALRRRSWWKAATSPRTTPWPSSGSGRPRKTAR